MAFPGYSGDHPAMSAMIMNIAANMLGLGNAATPMGIKAMAELDKLNPRKGTATNAMCLFLAINTSNIAFAAARASSPSGLRPGPRARRHTDPDPYRDLLRHRYRHHDLPSSLPAEARIPWPRAAPWKRIRQIAARNYPIKPRRRRRNLGRALSVKSFAIARNRCLFRSYPLSLTSPRIICRSSTTDLLMQATGWLVPLLMGFFLLFGYFRGVKVYEALTDGAKEGFQVAVRIIPFLVAIFVAIGMFRESGALDLFAKFSTRSSRGSDFRLEALPVALLRPLSGTGSFAAMTEVINHAPEQFRRRSSFRCCRVRPRPPFMCWRFISEASGSGKPAMPSRSDCSPMRWGSRRRWEYRTLCLKAEG